MWLLWQWRLVVAVVVVIIVVISAVGFGLRGPHPVKREDFRQVLPESRDIGHRVDSVFALSVIGVVVILVPPSGSRVPRRFVQIYIPRVVSIRVAAGLAVRRFVRHLLLPGDESATVALGVLVQLGVASAHVDQQFRSVWCRERRSFSSSSSSDISDEEQNRSGGRKTTDRGERQVQWTQSTSQGAFWQTDERFAVEFFVGADDLLRVQVEFGLVAAFLGAQHVPEPVDGTVADERVAADAQRGEPVDRKLRWLQGRQIAVAQRHPPVTSDKNLYQYRQGQS